MQTVQPLCNVDMMSACACCSFIACLCLQHVQCVSTVLYLAAGNWGVHLTIPKWAFTNINDTETPYVPVTVTGGSNLLHETMAAVARANNIATAG